jgi:Histone deacetylase domain
MLESARLLRPESLIGVVFVGRFGSDNTDALSVRRSNADFQHLKKSNIVCITPTRGMGFCLFNSIAVAARYAQRKFGVARVLIADWDVHHGNGTQDTFYTDGTVLFFSTHQHQFGCRGRDDHY